MTRIECSNCGALANVERGSYHFKGCGLSNVVLLSIEVSRCPECGNEDPIIPRMNDLMCTLALAVISQEYRLQGEEVRFLRKYLGMNGEEFSRLLSVDKTTLSKWETQADPIGERSDKLIRAIIMLACDELREKRDGHERLKMFREMRSSFHQMRIQVDARDMTYHYV